MTTDRRTGAQLIRRLRESRGWSWTDLARAMRDVARQLGMTSLVDRQVTSVQRAVARWESPTGRTSPGDRYQVLLAHVYARTPSGEWALGAATDFRILLEALGHFGISAQRLQELVELVTRGARSESSEQQFDDDFSHLHATVSAIDAQVGSVPFVRLRLELGPIVVSCRRLLRPDSDDVPEGLVHLATRSYGFAARLAFETGDDDAAQTLYEDAAEVAGRLEDRSHRAAVRISQAMVTLHATDDPEAARSIARAATVDAHQGASSAIRARAHAVHAEICARAGQAGEATDALSRAWGSLHQDVHGGFNGDRLRGFEGLCALHFGQVRRAHDHLGRSLSALNGSTRDAVQRAIVSTDLAVARLRLGDPIACAELVHDAVDLTAAVGGRVAAQRIRLVRRELRPWRSERFLAELDDHIHDALIGR